MKFLSVLGIILSFGFESIYTVSTVSAQEIVWKYPFGQYQKWAREMDHMFVIKSESVSYCPATEQYKFEIKFADTPDYWTYDQHGRTQNFMQYHIRYNEYPSSYMDNNIMIWSREIDATGDIVIREFHGDGGPGGWGPIRGTVPYDPHNKTICFFVSADMIGDHDGEIFYYLHTGLYGASLEQYRYYKRQKDMPFYRVGIRNKSTIQSKYVKGLHRVTMERAQSWGAIKSLYR